jgi:hypothetical protein
MQLDGMRGTHEGVNTEHQLNGDIGVGDVMVEKGAIGRKLMMEVIETSNKTCYTCI